MNTILIEDSLKEFIPQNNETKYIILGTMVTSSARTISKIPPKEVFYYNNPKNQFWKILSHIFSNQKEPLDKISDRKKFLDKFGIAVANIVENAQIAENDSNDSSDAILFNAHKHEKLKVKKISNEFKKLLQSRPIFFTCKDKPPLRILLESYFENNGLEKKFSDQVIYLPSPTRCNAVTRGDQWKELGLKSPLHPHN